MNTQPSNILIDALPDTVKVNGRVYPISTDFRIGMLFEMLINDTEIDDGYKPDEIVSLYFPDEAPDDTEEAINAILWFYRCGAEEKEKPGKNGGKKCESPSFKNRIYDFEIDAPLIYAAFMQQYRIDLTEADLHWWKFSALFKGLTEDCEISRIMSYRGADLRSIKDKSERSRIAKLQAKYALPCTMSKEDKVHAVGAMFGGRL